MTRETLLTGLIAALALAAIAIGLATVGGPGTARMEDRDNARIRKLSGAIRIVTCLAERNGEALPETLAGAEDCGPAKDLQDPFDQTPIRYERLDENRYQFCLTFELPEYREDGSRILAGHYQADTGCVVFNYLP